MSLHMTPFEAISTLLTLLAVIVTPWMRASRRDAVKWAQVEGKLDAIVDRLSDIVSDKDRIHGELAAQMREDRKATDERLRWLERQRSQRQSRTSLPWPARQYGDSV
jgi:hypothetical protein